MYIYLHRILIIIYISQSEILYKIRLYAQERINEIVQKTKDEALYDNTIFVVVTDNAGNTGQAMPLRGQKGKYSHTPSK